MITNNFCTDKKPNTPVTLPKQVYVPLLTSLRVPLTPLNTIMKKYSEDHQHQTCQIKYCLKSEFQAQHFKYDCVLDVMHI